MVRWYGMCYGMMVWYEYHHTMVCMNGTMVWYDGMVQITIPWYKILYHGMKHGMVFQKRKF